MNCECGHDKQDHTGKFNNLHFQSCRVQINFRGVICKCRGFWEKQK